MDLYPNVYIPGDDLRQKLVLASSSGDRTIRFWDIGTGDCIVDQERLPTKG